ncbi:hypothetical protein D9M70_504640 [compost metagenome]
MIDDDGERLVEMRMRVTLRQQPQECSERLNAIDRGCRFHQPRGPQLHRLDAEFAHMLVKPRAPGDFHRIARLQHRLHDARAARAHHAEMPAVGGAHDLHDGRAFAVPSYAENNGLIAPLHGYGIHPRSKADQAMLR